LIAAVSSLDKAQLYHYNRAITKFLMILSHYTFILFNIFLINFITFLYN